MKILEFIWNLKNGFLDRKLSEIDVICVIDTRESVILISIIRRLWNKSRYKMPWIAIPPFGSSAIDYSNTRQILNTN